jgi:quinohemoprotein amine dehydrogenase
MRSAKFPFIAVTLAWLVVTLAVTQAQQPTTTLPAEPEKPEEGIPITSPLVQKACGPCHTTDDKQQISRLSFQRNTPEGWQDSLKRMIALNGLQIDPQTAREVVKYLSNHMGLAPEEARAGAFEVERRTGDFKYAANSDAEGVCTRCHSMARVISQRRTHGEWDLLIAMHRGWYPLVDRQVFRRLGPAPRDRGPDGRPPDLRQPVEKAIDHLAKTFPLQTPEWAAWSASMRPARIDGTWALTGWEPGKGAIYGRVVLTPAPPTGSTSSGSTVSGVEPSTTDEFTSEITYTYARSGQTVSRMGRVVIYTGFQWRGRSMQAGDDKTGLREVMFVERDWRSIDGRWFTGGYDEQGIDVKLDRVGRETLVLGADRTALKSGEVGQRVKIFAANLPASVQPRDVDLGPGVTVSRVESATPEALTLLVDVAAKAAVGPRDLVLPGGVAKPAVLTVYDHVDSIRVTPSWNMARVGGVTFPKMYAQFEAWGYHNGVDGKPDTADDLKLDIVNVSWSLEEYAATYDDDDTKWVGTLDAKTGLFTPNIEGPNPKRVGERNNVGDVWAVANYVQEGMSAPPKPALRARAHLLVTVPLYMKFDPSVTP